MAHRADPKALLEKGDDFYRCGKYAHAELAFLGVIRLCGCGIGLQKQPCPCKDIVQGIKRTNLADVLKTVCTCPASSDRRCRQSDHLRAFDSLIAVYERQNRIDESFQCAMEMVNLNPRDPKGYLRLGKVFRLKNLPALAHSTYTQGIQLVQRKDPDHPLLPKLREQRDNMQRRARFDPIIMLPLEIWCMVFTHLDFQSQCRCLRVSKAWRASLTAKDAQRLWWIQEYNLPQKVTAAMREGIKKKVMYAGHHVTELSVNGCRHFMTQCGNIPFLFLTSHLKILRLRETDGYFDLQPQMIGPLSPSKSLGITNLHLGKGVGISADLLRRLVEACSNSLEELSVFQLPHPMAHPMTSYEGVPSSWFHDWPMLERLKVIRLVAGRRPAHITSGPEDIMRLAPNVEDVWMDYFDTGRDLRGHPWPKLRSLFLGKNTSWDFVQQLVPLLNDNMRELHLESSFPSFPELIPSTRFAKLEKLSLDSRRITAPVFDVFVRPSIESGTLRELDVQKFPAKAILEGAKEIDWFKSESITHISLAGFNADHYYEDRRFDSAILGLLDRFPNLRSLDIGQEMISDTMLARMIRGGVKTIYHQLGPVRTELRTWAARKHGAQVINGVYPQSPSLHPDRYIN
ncbi:hypothetical protein AAE478_007107 [Parahypoxylon ruwenzoriense]